MPTEVELRPIPGVIGYAAGSDGFVYSFHRGGDRGPKYTTTPMRLRGMGVGKYLAITLCWRGMNREYTHRLILNAFLGPCPEGFEASHLDGNPRNNRPENLRWESHRENNNRRLVHGTMPMGEGSPLSKLTAQQVMEIRRRKEDGEVQRRLAAEYGVSPMTVSRIVNNKMWTHLEEGR